MYPYIIPIITLIIFLVSLIINQKKDFKYHKYLLYSLVLLQVIYSFFTINEKIKSSDKIKQIDANIFTVMSAITYEKLSKTGYSPQQLDKIIDIKKQLEILYQSIKIDSIIQKSYHNYLSSLKINLQYIQGMVDTAIFYRTLSKIGNFKYQINKSSYYLTPNSIRYSKNIPIHIIGFIALACLENNLKINKIESFPPEDNSYSLVEITYEKVAADYLPISLDEIRSISSTSLKGMPNKSQATGSRAIPSPPSNFFVKKIKNGFELSWVTSQDKIMTDFEIRYDIKPITNYNFKEAFILYDSPPPKPGNLQKVYLMNVDNTKKFYFAIRVFNATNNSSTIVISDV